MSTRASGSPDSRDQIPGRLSDVGPGWHPLLRSLHDQLAALAPDYRLEELTVKLGGLRLYVADRFDADGEFDGDWADAAGALTDAAELAAEKTCESCGGPGRPRFHGDRHGTWIRTLCDPCRTNRSAAATEAEQAPVA
ncbi:TraR/DksA family transcriptional regulator [Streptomyces roseicoloratus]|uniref:TraR/DksA family transcriptional regulator n=1 Tax=Streptomyces roseicoloratus TaxID=2508722 RepID=UPI0010098D78|nr:TraR/DksA family transcriptional regulator [Streptomyces roseicoloratus]